MSRNTWENNIINEMKIFAKKYSFLYKKSERQIAAHFEIGCFLALVEFYEKSGYIGNIINKSKNGSYRYLTTPSGNPNNFSYIHMSHNDEHIEIRQQVRVYSHIGDDIYFTPDIVVIPHNTNIANKYDSDYAGGKKLFFYVHSNDLIAAHECKSMVLFPELLVSFVGMFLVGHKWADNQLETIVSSKNATHLAPTLFVGGNARPMNSRMIEGLKKVYPINIIVGLHSGTWNLFGSKSKIKIINNPLSTNQIDS